jgi:uncharacterized membrane protein
MIELAHIHVMIVHLPIVGTALAMIPLVWGFVTKNRTIQLLWLIMLGLSLIGLPIAMGTGEEAFEKFMSGWFTPDLDEGGAHYALLHYQAADFVGKIGYGVLILIGALIVFWKQNFPYKNTLYIFIILLNILLIVGFSYVGYLGGKIRHPEFRPTMSSEIWVINIDK